MRMFGICQLHQSVGSAGPDRAWKSGRADRAGISPCVGRTSCLTATTVTLFDLSL